MRCDIPVKTDGRGKGSVFSPFMTCSLCQQFWLDRRRKAQQLLKNIKAFVSGYPESRLGTFLFVEYFFFAGAAFKWPGNSGKYT
jgi:hypothetical protein